MTPRPVQSRDKLPRSLRHVCRDGRVVVLSSRDEDDEMRMTDSKRSNNLWLVNRC